MSVTPDLTLEDREAIRDIIAAYCHAIDRRRWDIMPGLFHEDATFAFGPLVGDWRSFVEQARGVIDDCTHTHHHLGQVLFGKMEDGVVHTETYMSAMHIIPPGYPLTDVFPARDEEYAAVIAGRYIDRFEKRTGEWRIAQRTGVYDWREFRDIGEASLSNLPAEACGQHDYSDPSTPAAAHWRG